MSWGELIYFILSPRRVVQLTLMWGDRWYSTQTRLSDSLVLKLPKGRGKPVKISIGIKERRRNSLKCSIDSGIGYNVAKKCSTWFNRRQKSDFDNSEGLGPSISVTLSSKFAKTPSKSKYNLLLIVHRKTNMKNSQRVHQILKPQIKWQWKLSGIFHPVLQPTH